ncbi:MAG: hypothetical protein BWY44_00995 [Candidatus Omnitrophica bacterium ADurb.Bin292]|nr:MAG: hypothetical protein BWY44_00995 [Candidatus Omnitrophica bacterium ADurb.Bin292]
MVGQLQFHKIFKNEQFFIAPDRAHVVRVFSEAHGNHPEKPVQILEQSVSLNPGQSLRVPQKKTHFRTELGRLPQLPSQP